MVSDELAISIGATIGATLHARPSHRVHGGSLRRANAVRVPRVLGVRTSGGPTARVGAGAAAEAATRADIAMTRLFGGYGREFYAAYEGAWALDPGASTRTDLYNLYHVLNHLNLFGSGYLGQATAMIDNLLAAAGH